MREFVATKNETKRFSPTSKALMGALCLAAIAIVISMAHASSNNGPSTQQFGSKSLFDPFLLKTCQADSVSIRGIDVRMTSFMGNGPVIRIPVRPSVRSAFKPEPWSAIR
jgi:hypothetical protein